jgi:hypothetical protein
MMRPRHPAFLAARVLTGLITVTPVNHDDLDRFIEAKAAEEEAKAQAPRSSDRLGELGAPQARRGVR